MILVFDTETSGKADFKSHWSAPHQPHIVQLAAVVVDNHLEVAHKLSMIVRPNGWTIPDEAAKIHGITTERALDCGVDLKTALAVFSQLSKLCGTRVAHNIDFDDLVVSTGFFRIEREWDRERHTPFCTMKAMTDICCLPGPYGNKWPKLEEAYHYAVGEPMTGAHDALADVMACLEVYRWYRENAQVNA